MKDFNQFRSLKAFKGKVIRRKLLIQPKLNKTREKSNVIIKQSIKTNVIVPLEGINILNKQSNDNKNLIKNNDLILIKNRDMNKVFLLNRTNSEVYNRILKRLQGDIKSTCPSSLIFLLSEYAYDASRSGTSQMLEAILHICHEKIDFWNKYDSNETNNSKNSKNSNKNKKNTSIKGNNNKGNIKNNETMKKITPLLAAINYSKACFLLSLSAIDIDGELIYLTLTSITIELVKKILKSNSKSSYQSNIHINSIDGSSNSNEIVECLLIIDRLAASGIKNGELAKLRDSINVIDNNTGLKIYNNKIIHEINYWMHSNNGGPLKVLWEHSAKQKKIRDKNDNNIPLDPGTRLLRLQQSNKSLNEYIIGKFLLFINIE
jgi:hypothetical protein